MSLVVVGLNERDAPLELLERLAVAEADLPKALALLCDSPHLSEAVVLSTCMRTEVYAVLDRFHDGLADINAFFHARAGTSPVGASALEEKLMVAYDDAAARHLFEVAAGSQSAVLGEGEILRQVRSAGEYAQSERAAGPVLGGLFRHAVEVGKRSRSETSIARGITSLSHVAVVVADRDRQARLGEATCLVVGAGEMGAGITNAIAARHEDAAIVVVSRTERRAASLAASVGGRVASVADLAHEVGQSDVVFSATSSPEIVITADELAQVMAARQGRPLTVVDVAVPRDFDPSAAEIPGVHLFDLAHLRQHAQAEMDARAAQLDHVHAIVDEELERYRTRALGRSVSPVVAALRSRSEQVRLAELARISSKLEHLGPDDRELIETLTRRLVAKLVHEPTVQVKKAAGSLKGERLADALRQLYDL